ncbi:RloB domain-containing protein [Labilibaculum manganireducens]|uniref:RloB domain-containing protein n=1 Tax=Labilibaculum manganireducens TaxID=1940525 RepID=UPI0029F46932|nr:RloB domain-containing protein [Labilibaculum manganireducens]
MGRPITRKRKLKRGVAVLGDGRTEQYYLKHLKDIKGYKYSIKPSLFDCINLYEAEEIIDNLKEDGYELIVFFTDYDTIISQGRLENFLNFKHKYKKDSNVLICESMPSIEYWFLLHFIKSTKEYTNADQAFNDLKKHLKIYSKKIKDLEKPDWVRQLCDDGRMDIAVKNSFDILKVKLNEEVGEHFPFSKAHLGIEKFE